MHTHTNTPTKTHPRTTLRDNDDEDDDVVPPQCARARSDAVLLSLTHSLYRWFILSGSLKHTDYGARSCGADADVSRCAAAVLCLACERMERSILV